MALVVGGVTMPDVPVYWLSSPLSCEYLSGVPCVMDGG